MAGKVRFAIAVFVLSMTVVLIAALSQALTAEAHFFGGQTRDVGTYSIVFVPSPDPPYANSNKTTLNFSVLVGGDNIYNVQTAMVVKDRSTNKTVVQTNFVTKEFSDVTYPFVFPHPGDYIVTLFVKVAGDKNYTSAPLSVDFNVSAFDPKFPVPFDELMLLYVTPAAVVIGGIVVYLHSKNKI